MMKPSLGLLDTKTQTLDGTTSVENYYKYKPILIYTETKSSLRFTASSRTETSQCENGILNFIFSFKVISSICIQINHRKEMKPDQR